MKHKLIAVAVLSAVSTSAFAGNESWALGNGGHPGLARNAIYDPAQGPLPMERRFLMTREGAEEARYNAQNPAPAVVSQPATVALTSRWLTTKPAWQQSASWLSRWVLKSLA